MYIIDKRLLNRTEDCFLIFLTFVIFFILFLTSNYNYLRLILIKILIKIYFVLKNIRSHSISLTRTVILRAKSTFNGTMLSTINYFIKFFFLLFNFLFIYSKRPCPKTAMLDHWSIFNTNNNNQIVDRFLSQLFQYL